MSEGRNTFGWVLVATPLVLVAFLFVLSSRLGLVAAGIIAVTAVLYLGSVLLVTRARKPCPNCHAKKLKCINYFRVNPPPNHAFYRCEECGREYVRVDGQPDFVERENSHHKNGPGWDAG